MNWYKIAQKKTFDEILRGLESNPEVDRAILSWLKTLPSDKMGPAANMLMKNPRATVQEIEAKLPKVVPLSKEQEHLIANYPLIREWMRGILIGSSVSKREAVFNTLKEKAARIRDWAERTQAQMQGRSLENAVKETEKWHEESAAFGKGEYLPTRPEDIVVKYPNGFTWQRVSRGIDAKIEGNKMNHCVGNYCEDVDEGKISVYSLRDKTNTPMVTAGFKHDNKVVVQMKGKNDEDPVGQGYSKYISDILAKLGTIYNDGENHLKKGFDLKELNYLTEEEIEKDDLVKKIVHNDIVRKGIPPKFAEDWAKKTLESGKAPQEWIDGIRKYLVTYQNFPNFAEDWAGKILESGKAPQEWMDAINKRIEKYADVPHFAYDWAKNMLESGKAPKEWIDGINSYIEKWGSPSSFTADWAKNILESGNAPKAWTDRIHMRYVPTYAEEWVKNTLESGNAPKEWMNDIEKNLGSTSLSSVVQNWTKQVLDYGNAPQKWIDTISKHIVENGNPPKFADDWVKKILDSGNAPQKWINAISKFIVENGNQANPPEFAADWAKNVLESGNAPRALIKAINNFIEKYADVPKFAIDWAKNVLNSGKIPQEWMDAIVDRIEKMGEPPIFAYEWARLSLNSLVGPIELEQAAYFHIDNNSYIPHFAYEWAEKTGLLEKLRSEQLE